MDGNGEGVEPVRRTRSGRLSLTPKACPKSKRTPKGKKSPIVTSEQESDEDQQLDSDNDVDNSVTITTEEEVALLDESNATDNCMLEDELLLAGTVGGEDSNSATNDFNSFKGAASSSEHMGEESNSFDVEQGNSGEGNGEKVEDVIVQDEQITEQEEEQDPISEHLLINDDDDIEMIDIPEIPDIHETPDEMPLLTNGLNPENPNPDQPVEEAMSTDEPIPEVSEAKDTATEATAADATDAAAAVESVAESVEADDVSDDDDKAGLSSDGGVKVVPEAEEVSDEELPGPKRAELPADTEVVSEDELPTVKGKKDAGKGGKGKRKLAEGDYDPGSPTSENESAPSKKPALGEEEDGDKEDEEEAGKVKKLPELDKYWKAVNDDPTDFTGWTYLLQYVDQENDMEAAREAYDAFLSHYPYCYGYWRKYADYEKRKGNKKKCEELHYRGQGSIPATSSLVYILVLCVTYLTSYILYIYTYILNILSRYIYIRYCCCTI